MVPAALGLPAGPRLHLGDLLVVEVGVARRQAAHRPEGHAVRGGEALPGPWAQLDLFNLLLFY